MPDHMSEITQLVQTPGNGMSQALAAGGKILVCALRYLVEQGLHAEYVFQLPSTRRTEELGEKYSPDFVCTPFKTLLGSMIEALEAGADTLLMIHGICRLGCYGELQEQILRDLGYEFDFLDLAEYDTGKRKDWIRAVRRLDPKADLPRLTKAGVEAARMVERIASPVVFQGEKLIDAWGNRCERGAVAAHAGA